MSIPLCQNIFANPVGASGCVDPECMFSHSPGERRGDNFAFFDVEFGALGVPQEHYVEWLELRNDNRIRITKFTSVGDFFKCLKRSKIFIHALKMQFIILRAKKDAQRLLKVQTCKHLLTSLFY